jgi:hypothetical protein
MTPSQGGWHPQRRFPDLPGGKTSTNEIVVVEEFTIQVDAAKRTGAIDFVCLIGAKHGKTRPGICAFENGAWTLIVLRPRS